jgi:hypothetical protein
MNDSHIKSVSQIKNLLKLSQKLQCKALNLNEKYSWINDILTRLRYFSLKKKDKSIVKKYISLFLGLSRAQITRLITKKKKFGVINPSSSKKNSFKIVYDTDDIALIAKTDEAHNFLSGSATKRIFQREFDIFNNQKFEKLKDISVSHIYNLRQTNQYRSQAKHFTKTKPNSVNIGTRKKLDPNNQPGFLRVDTVHQGDLLQEKGVYHINLVDEVTQWEIVAATEKISERYLIPVLENALTQFPFVIKNFHSDNGSEYINKTIAKLLNKLLIQQTKSRSRKCNDNGLVESKNGSSIRKHMGYLHIKQKYAPKINEFY